MARFFANRVASLVGQVRWLLDHRCPSLARNNRLAIYLPRLSPPLLAVIGFGLTPFAVDLPNRHRFSAEPFGRIIDRAERGFTSALATLGEGNSVPPLADDVGFVAHFGFTFINVTPAPSPDCPQFPQVSAPSSRNNF
jgi:hypothetical protein